MAFPVVAARITGRTANTDVTSHAITMPAGIVAGNLLLVVFTSDGAPTVTAATGGWTKLNQASSTTVVTGATFYKVATGGDALTLTTSVAEQSSHVSFRITGAGGTPVAALTATSATGTTANTDPAAHTPAAGSRDYLWIATRSGDSTTVATAAPASYANLQSQAAQGTSGASTNTAERSLAAATENPGTFTSAAIAWVSWTIAVPPANATAVPVLVASTATVGLPAAGVTLLPVVVASTASVTSPTVASTVTTTPALVASSASVAAPTVATYYPAPVASTASVPTPTVTTYYPVTVASTASVPLPTVTAHQAVTIALVASTASVALPSVVVAQALAPVVVAATPSVATPTITTSVTAVPALVASAASVPGPTITSTVAVTTALVASTSSVAAPTVPTHYPVSVASTSSVAAPTVATYYPTAIPATGSVATPTVVAWLRPTPVVNRPAALAPTTGLAPSTSLLPSAGGDRFFPPTATVNLQQTHLPELVGPAASVGAPTAVAGGISAVPAPVASTATVWEPTLDTVTLYRYPRMLTRAVVPSPSLAPSIGLVPATGLSTVYPPKAWLGVPQTVTGLAPVASTATVGTPAVSATVRPRFLTRAVAPAAGLAPSTSLVPAAGLSRIYPPVTPIKVFPAAVPAGPVSWVNLYPSPDLYPTPDLYPSKAQIPAPTVQLGAVVLTPETVPPTAAVGVPTPTGSGVNFVPLFTPTAVTSTAAVLPPTVWVEVATVEAEFVDSAEVVETPNVVLQGEILLLAGHLPSAAAVHPPALSVGAAQVSPALVVSAATVAAPQVAAPSLQTLAPQTVPSTAAVARPRPPAGTPTRPRPGAPVAVVPVRAGAPVAPVVVAAIPAPAGVGAGVPVPA